MKADMEAMKEQMKTIMEAMMSVRKMMEVNTTTVVALGENVNDSTLILIENQQPNLIMHMSLNPWGKHMRLPNTTLWPILGPTPDIPLKGMHFLVPPCQTLQGGLSINHHPDP